MSTNDRMPEQEVLVLQGGGALGAYQAGVFQGLVAGGVLPCWVAGISIGAINAAIIAGNAPEHRVDRLREFWDQTSSSVQWPGIFGMEASRPWFTEISAAWVAAFGVPGFFAPRFPPPILQPPGTPEAISFYDTGPLRTTLERLIDFERINSPVDSVRLSVGAVNVRTGNFTYFDNRHQLIGPEHVMASGALPPGFPPVEIDGEFYWDGGLVSNTPMQYVMDQELDHDLLVFQVDLFSSRGEVPRTLMEVAERAKDIQYSSRTRMNTDTSLKLHRAKSLVRELIAEAPPALRKNPKVRELEAFSQENAVTVAHLINRPRHYDSNTKDFEFSRNTMLEHWASGMEDVERTLTSPTWIQRKRPEYGVAVFDLGRSGPKEVVSEDLYPKPEQERAHTPEAAARSADLLEEAERP